MNKVSIRPGQPSDADAIAKVIYDAFDGIATKHGQVSDFDSPPIDRTHQRLKHLDQFNDYCVVAEAENQVVGVNFIDGHGDVGAIGVLAVLPTFQGQRIGKRLMESAIEHGRSVGYKSQRLLQAAYNSKSMGLYLSLGMVVREHLVNLNGTVSGDSIGSPDILIERASEEDVIACSKFCEKYYRAGRSREINDAAVDGGLLVARESGNIVGLTTSIGFSGFSVASTNDVLKSLIVNQATIEPPGILAPATNHSLIKWCLDSGLKISQSMNLMTLGEYEEPVGRWLPSINF
jgi:predicted N-acetyltransferase YhbS